MNVETKKCQNCKNNFTIEPDDFSFYEKIGVPPPTWCPECRRQRRFTWRNERTLHKRKCDLCKKPVIGLYPSATTFPVYCHDCWHSDQWNPLSFGREYDFQKPFFSQLKLLQDVVPRLAIFNTQSINSEYTNQSYNNKNSYLSFALRDCEDVAYLTKAVAVKNTVDAVYTHHSDFLYECLDVDKSYKSRFLIESEGCVDSAFLSDCRNCQQCVGGVNLRSANNIFFGEKLTKEQLAAQIKNLDTGSYKTQEELKRKFSTLKEKLIHKSAKLINCVNCIGDHLSNSKNCHYVFDGFELENVRYSSWVFTSKEISDAYGMGGSEFIYESIGIEDVNNIKFCNVTDSSDHVQYTDLCFSSSHLFACIGLKNKDHCILNRQYSKGEYESLVSRIIKQMNEMPYMDKNNRVYRYGEFFPSELSPFAYNETIAQECYPLTKEIAAIKGYRWGELEERNYQSTISNTQLPDHIKDVKDSIVSEIIACGHEGRCSEQCTTAFKITPQEFEFYKYIQIPLPRLCANCRYYQRLKQRNPLKLWHRRCTCGGSKSENGVYVNTTKHFHDTSHCPNEFETSYAPDRPEIVYCEQCYNPEVV